MEQNIKLEVAIEIIASKIAEASREGYTVNSEKMKLLLEEQKQVYKCNYNVIEKVLNVYGKEIKEKYSEG